MFESLWSLLTTDEEKNTARLVLELSVVMLSDNSQKVMWTATFDYLHDQKPVEAGGIGETPDEAYADVVRMVALGKQHERQVLALGDTANEFFQDELF